MKTKRLSILASSLLLLASIAGCNNSTPQESSKSSSSASESSSSAQTSASSSDTSISDSSSSSKTSESSSESSSMETSSSSSESSSSIETSSSSSMPSSSESSSSSSSQGDLNPLAKYKRTVTKKQGKDFKILNLTDIQLHDNEVTSYVFGVIDQLVEKEKPDMITFLGDLLNDSEFYKSVINCKAVIDKIDSFGIPWAPIFGNHDYEDYNTPYTSMKTTTSEDLIKMYNAANNCLFIRGPEEVSGKSNYIVNIVEEGTNKLVESLYFMDSRLGGLDDTHTGFYMDAVGYSKELNGGVSVPSVIFTHIALPQYGDALEEIKASEYRNIVGSINREPTDLASGSKTLFPEIKKQGVTDLVVCGHDHENAYYSVYDGVRLAYSMKSSNGDKYDNFAQLGGSVVVIGGEDEGFYYSKANIEETFSSDLSIKPDTLGYWRYSGAKLCFDLSLPVSGSMKFSIMGTNLQRSSKEEDYRYGQWNRLTSSVTFNAGDKAVSVGSLKQIEGNKYSYELDLTSIDLNNGGGEEACGDETARLVYFNSVNGEFGISNVRYEFEEITETNQIDLSAATVNGVVDKPANNGIPVKQDVTVQLGGETLNPVSDILVRYEDNVKEGKAKLIVVPSGKGAHKYKGSKTVEFNVTKGAEISRGVEFFSGVDYNKDIDPLTIATDTLIVDVKFTSADDTKINIMVGDWTNYFGYFAFYPTTTASEYAGISVSKTTDGYMRLTFKLSALTKTSGVAPADVRLVYLRGAWSTATGFIDINPTGGSVIRGEAFAVATDYSKDIDPLTIATDTLVVDVKFTSADDTKINIMVGTWNDYFGYFAFYPTTTVSEYNGITVSKTADGYMRLTFKLSELTKTSGVAPADVRLVYIRGAWSTASGYVDINPA